MKIAGTTLAAAAAVSALALSGCGGGAKDPLSANSAVVARTVSLDLTAARLAQLIGGASARVPITHDNAVVLANFWSSYHRLAYAAAHNDSLSDKLDVGITPLINRQRVAQLLALLRQSATIDTTVSESDYDKGAHALYAARHILFRYPANPTRAQADSVRKLAVSVLPTLTAANFPDMAKKYSGDAPTATQGGSLGVFFRGGVIAPIGSAVATLKPGMISPLIATQFGIDVVERMSWAEAKDQFTAAIKQIALGLADSVIEARITRSAQLEIKPNTMNTVRAATQDPVAHNADSTVIATFNRAGTLTIAQYLGWLNSMPPQQRVQAVRMIPQASDSVADTFTRNVATLSVLLRMADSMKIDTHDADRGVMRDQLRKVLVDTWKALGVAPEQLASEAKTEPEREHVAAERIDKLIDEFAASQANVAPISIPLEQALDAKYPTQLSPAAIDNAVAAAAPIRAAADSARGIRGPAAGSGAPASTAGAKPPGKP